MTNPFYFSDHIGPAINKIRFAAVVVKRFIRLLFSREKQLIVQQLNYRNQYRFDQSFLLIRYQFKNALWYDFEGIKKTTGAGVIALNLRNVPEMPVTLTVQGFFRKKTYKINIDTEAGLKTRSFGVSLNKPRNLQSNLGAVKTGKRFFKTRFPEVSVTCSISRKSTPIKTRFFTFHQTKLL